MSLIKIEHPLIEHHVTLLRDKDTSTSHFRRLVDRITLLMTFEMAKDFELEPIEIETPLQKMIGNVLKKKSIVVVPILRAGLGMLNGVLELIPDAIVAHVGLERDHETFKPRTYYHKLPASLHGKDIIVVDPMLATGGSMRKTIDFLVENGADPARIKVMCLVAVPEGVKAIEDSYPDIPIYAAAYDERLNDKAYILPGLGDAGDRLYGTF